MILSKRVTQYLFLLLYCISLLLRYPLINGPYDSDSFVIQGMSLKFTAYGFIPWLLSVRSYFGMYPFSYPSAVPVLHSVVSQTTGLNSEISILVLCLFMGIMGINNMFLLSKHFGGNFFSILCMISFLTSFYFLNYSYWTIPARGLFLTTVPLFLYFLVKLINFKIKDFFLMLALYFMLLSTHRSHAYVFLVFVIPYFLLRVSDYFKFIDLKRRFNSSPNLKIFYAFIIPLPFLMSIYYIEFYHYFGIPVAMNWIIERYQGVYIAPLLNYAFRMVGSNPLSAFGLIGFFTLTLKNYYNSRHFFITLVTLFSSAFLVDYEYFTPTILPIVSLLAGYGMFTFIKNINHQIFNPIMVVAFLLIISSSTTFYLNQLNTNTSAERYNPPEIEGYGLTQESRNNARWIGQYIGSNNTVIDGYYNTEHYSLVNMSTVRQIDLVSEHSNYVDYLVVEEFSLFDVFFNQREIYYGGTVTTLSDSEVYYSSVLYEIYASSIDSSPDYNYLEIFEVSYVIEPASGEKWFLEVPEFDIYEEDTPHFFFELYEERYKIYSNEMINIYSFDEHK